MDAGMLAPEPEPGGVVLDATGWYWVLRFMTAKKNVARWEAERVEARDKLIEIMKHYEYGHHNGKRVVTVTRVRPMNFNSRAFAEDHPALWDQYREEAPEQVRVTPAKDASFPEIDVDFPEDGAS